MYFTQEEKVLARKEYNVRFYEKNKYYCEARKEEYHITSKLKHKKSQKHRRNVEKEVDVMRGRGKVERKEEKWLGKQRRKLLREERMSAEMNREIRRPIEMMLLKPLERALKVYTKSNEIRIFDEEEPRRQLDETRRAVERILEEELRSFKGIQFLNALKITAFKKIVTERGVGEIAYKTAYFNLKAQVAVNGEDIGNMVEIAIGNILDGIDRGTLHHTSNYQKN